MTDIKREPTKEELIKADSQEPESTPAPKQEEQQSEDNAKADKEFEEMSKDLDMFTK